MDVADAYARFETALDDFAKGNPQPVKALSHRADATLANPFGPPARGWDDVSKMLDYASSRFRDGAFLGTERIAEFPSTRMGLCAPPRASEQKRVTAKRHPRVHVLGGAP
jgi:hypothetical protein